MKRILMTMIVALGLMAPTTAIAHDAKLHKGKATKGEITSVADDRFEMKTAAGTMTVSFSSKTKFEHGSQAVDKTHLKQGETVSVIGTKLPSGELVAKEVMLGAPADHSAMKHDADEKGKAEHKH